jgi:hypothetical protein
MNWRSGDSFQLKRDLVQGEYRCITAIRRRESGVILEIKYGEAWVRFENVKTARGPAEASFPVMELPRLIDPVYQVPPSESQADER